MHKRVLVLGAAGFTGRHFFGLVRSRKLQENFSFYAVDRTRLESVTSVSWFETDFSKRDEMARIVAECQPDVVMNFMGCFGSDTLEELMECNVMTSIRLLECLRLITSQASVLLIGSAAEYGRPRELPVREDHPLEPVTAYGLAKAAQTAVALHFYRSHGMSIVIARPFNLDGEGASPKLAAGAFRERIACAKDGDAVEVGNVSSRRDYLDIRKAVEAYWLIVGRGSPGTIYNVCSGRSVAIGDYLGELIRQSGKRLKVVSNDRLFRSADVPDIYGDNTRLIGLGWDPQ